MNECTGPVVPRHTRSLPSRVARDNRTLGWIVDWPLIYRDACALRALVPDRHAVAFDRSPDGGLVYAFVWAPGVAVAEPSIAGDRHVAG